MVETALDVGGAVTFWSLVAWTDRRRLADAFTALGLDAHVPEQRPATAALKDALEHTFAGPRVLVRPLAGRDGFAVVREERGSAANRYATDLVARITGEPPQLAFDPWDQRSAAVESAFQAQRGRVPAGQLAAALVKVVASPRGTRLRPSGAVY